jgi:hypothetical protein
VPTVDGDDPNDGRRLGDADDLTWRMAPVIRADRQRRDPTATIVVVGVALLAIAILKPWAALQPAGAAPPVASGRTSVVGQPSTPPTTARPQPAIVDPNAMACLVHQAEQVMTLERWPDREIKSWSGAVGAGTRFPDAQTPAVPIASSHLIGIGICPGTGPTNVVPAPGATPDLIDPLAWAGARITDVELVAGGTSDDLGPVPAITVQTDYVAAGVLFGPPGSPGVRPGASPGSGAATELPAWPPGRYALRYEYPGDPDHRIRWVVVDIKLPLNGQ